MTETHYCQLDLTSTSEATKVPASSITSSLLVSNQDKLKHLDISAASNSVAPVPSCYEESSLRDSLLSSQVDNMLEFLSKKKDLRLMNQQRGEPDLTSEQQLDILRTLFDSNPFSFLQRFGQHLEPIHLQCFSSVDGDMDPEKKSFLKLQIKALENVARTGNKTMLIKNRRYEALQKLVDTTNYFTEEEMQRRNPILFDQLIGKYHTKEEREAFLQLSQSSASTRTPLSDMLIAHMTRLEGNVSERRAGQETQIDQEEAADEEYFDNEAMDEDDDIPYGQNSNSKGIDDEEGREEIDEEEKDILKEEFFTTMYRSFLEGKDEDIDYNAVDNNEEYDCGEILNQDAEDKYFDAEDSEMDECTPERLLDLGADGESVEMNPHGTHNDDKVDDDEEDELDLYMKQIEKQLQKH